MLLFLSIKLSDHIIWILQYGSLCNISSLSVVQWFVVFHIQVFRSLWILPAAVMVSEWIPSRLIALLFHRLHTRQRAAAMLERQPLLWVLIALSSTFLPSVLSHCYFSVRKSIHPVKNWVMRCFCGCLSGARSRLFAYGPANAIASQNPVISCLI